MKKNYYQLRKKRMLELMRDRSLLRPHPVRKPVKPIEPVEIKKEKPKPLKVKGVGLPKRTKKPVVTKPRKKVFKPPVKKKKYKVK